MISCKNVLTDHPGIVGPETFTLVMTSVQVETHARKAFLRYYIVLEIEFTYLDPNKKYPTVLDFKVFSIKSKRYSLHYTSLIGRSDVSVFTGLIQEGWCCGWGRCGLETVT